MGRYSFDETLYVSTTFIANELLNYLCRTENFILIRGMRVNCNDKVMSSLVYI